MMIGTPDSARIARHTSMPSMPGQHQVEQHEVGLGLAERGERLVAVGAERRARSPRCAARCRASRRGRCRRRRPVRVPFMSTSSVTAETAAIQCATLAVRTDPRPDDLRGGSDREVPSQRWRRSSDEQPAGGPAPRSAYRCRTRLAGARRRRPPRLRPGAGPAARVAPGDRAAASPAAAAGSRLAPGRGRLPAAPALAPAQARASSRSGRWASARPCDGSFSAIRAQPRG